MQIQKIAVPKAIMEQKTSIPIRTPLEAGFMLCKWHFISNLNDQSEHVLL